MCVRDGRLERTRRSRNNRFRDENVSIRILVISPGSRDAVRAKQCRARWNRISSPILTEAERGLLDRFVCAAGPEMDHEMHDNFVSGRRKCVPSKVHAL